LRHGARRPGPRCAAHLAAGWRAAAPHAALLDRRGMHATREESVDVPEAYPKGRKRTPAALPQELHDLKLGFIGWGAMAQAVSLGILRKDLTSPENVMATDVVPQMMEAAVREGLRTATSARELVEWADIVVVAVKPQGVGSVLKDIGPLWKPNQILVSICAGVTIDTYVKGLASCCAIGEQAKVVRVMPNTPCLVGEAATAYAGSKSCLEWELELVNGMFAAVGVAHRVPEHLLDTVTGLSGSGPAYIYMLIQALSDAGVHGGLPRSVSLSLATQTVLGASKMVQESGQHPAVLKEAVTSPGGTTIAGVAVLERLGFSGTVMQAVDAARKRSEELSKP